jgi:hypothetical protein
MRSGGGRRCALRPEGREEHMTRDRDGDPRVIRDRRDSRSRAAALTLAIGGLVMVVASFLDWIDGREQLLTDPNAFQIPMGAWYLALVQLCCSWAS